MSMRLWQNQTGHLECRWSEAGQRVAYQATWMKEASEASGTYIPPIPDFASHSPFGGTVSWFLLHASKAKEKGNHHQQRTESDKSFCQLFCLSTVSSNEAQHTSTETSSSQQVLFVISLLGRRLQTTVSLFLQLSGEPQ